MSEPPPDHREVNTDKENPDTMPNVKTVHELSTKECWRHQRRLITEIAWHRLVRGSNAREAVYSVRRGKYVERRSPMDAEQVSVLVNLGYVAEETRTFTGYLNDQPSEPVTLHELSVTKQGFDFMRDLTPPRD